MPRYAALFQGINAASVVWRDTEEEARKDMYADWSVGLVDTQVVASEEEDVR